MLRTLRLRAPEALPEVTVTVFTVTVAFASVTVGVTVSDVTALPTESVYLVVPHSKTVSSVPCDRTRYARVASV